MAKNRRIGALLDSFPFADQLGVMRRNLVSDSLTGLSVVRAEMYTPFLAFHLPWKDSFDNNDARRARSGRGRVMTYPAEEGVSCG